MKPLAAFLAFAATIPAANWLIAHVGTTCIPNGPCLIPVGFGLMAPSGVLLVGLALVLRDQIHEHAGWRAALAAVLMGGAISAILAPPAIALASVVAFVLAEIADALVYAPLRARGRHVAVLASGLVGAIVDSALFLAIAFGSLETLVGLVVAKLYASLVVAAWFWIAPRRQPAA